MDRGGFHDPQGTGLSTDIAVHDNVSSGRGGGYACGMKKPLLGLIILAVMVALGFKIYKAMTVEVPVEDQG